MPRVAGGLEGAASECHQRPEEAATGAAAVTGAAIEVGMAATEGAEWVSHSFCPSSALEEEDFLDF